MQILHLTRSAVNYRISYLWLFFFVKWEFNDIRVAGYVMMLVNIRLEQKRRIALPADVYPVKPLLKHQLARHAF